LVSCTDPVPPPAKVTLSVNCVWAAAGLGSANHEQQREGGRRQNGLDHIAGDRDVVTAS
jgi:hypothetical protein